MPSTFTTRLVLEKQATGESNNTWGANLNTLFDLVDKAMAGVLSKSVAGSSDVTLTAAEAVNAIHSYTGTLTGNISVIVPATEKLYLISNATAGAFTLTVKPSGASGIVVTQGQKRWLYCDGTNVVEGITEVGSLNVAGAINEGEGSDVASASAPDIWATDGNTVHVTGTTTITDFANAPRIGAWRKLIFDGVLTFTHGSGITLPGSANITTAAGDIAFVYADAVDAFRVAYFKADGTPVVTSVVADTTPQSGGDHDMNANQMQWSKGADVASAAALPVLTDGNAFDVTGTTTITSINTTGGAGTVILLHFDGALTLTHHATNLILPGGANITTAAGDEAIFHEYGAGTYRCICYTKATGKAVIESVASVAAAALWIDDDALSTTSGTLQTISGIAGLNEIHIALAGISTNAANVELLIQLGDATSVETSGYSGSVAFVVGGTTIRNNSSGFLLTDNVGFDAAQLLDGSLILIHQGGNLWSCSFMTDNGSNNAWVGQGQKTLSGVLTRVRLTTVGGATFDAGTMRLVAR